MYNNIILIKKENSSGIYEQKERVLEDIRRVANFAVEFGADIIRCGGEVSRAEDTVSRICGAMGVERCEVFAINSYISVCTCDSMGNAEMISRRIKNRGTDLLRLEYLNRISRALCSGEIDLSEATSRFFLKNDKRRVPFIYLASCLVCLVFTLYFGGRLAEAAVSGIAATVTVWLKRKAKNGFGNAVSFTFISSFLCGTVGAVLVLLGFASEYSLIAKGDIMLLVPGVSIVCAGRDVICGELLTGLLEFTEAILIAIALVSGFALPEFIIELVRG